MYTLIHTHTRMYDTLFVILTSKHSLLAIDFDKYTYKISIDAFYSICLFFLCKF